MTKSTRPTKKNVLTMRRSVSATALARLTNTDIAARAFELYCARGYQHGFDVADWLQAERELRETASSSAA